MADYSEDYLLNKSVKIFQPLEGYRAAIDAVFLAAAVEKLHTGDTILDAGSGTGAVSLCLARRFAGAEITGLELQPQLAELSSLSAQANGFANLRYIQGSLFEPPLPFCSFAHVISNPPYFDPNMPASPQGGKATAHNFKAGGLKDWINACIKMIKPQGYLYLINRAEALDEILATLHGRLGEICVFPLYSKSGQAAKRVIVRARKDSKAPLRIAPGLIIHEEDSSYTEAAQSILRDGNCLSF